jgi:anthranilate phosphoribosyltransferase
VDEPPLAWFHQTLTQLLAHRELSDAQVRQLFQDLMAGRCGEAETAALLIALRMKGESAAEIAAAATVLRQHMVRLETGRGDLLDTCGTGGDEAGTFNISTATALVTAAAGVPVVKHGNRAVSSRSGGFDVLEALGIVVRDDLAWVRRCLDQVGVAFCFAPHFHPALRHVAAVRRRLGVRTLFNCLGPLANPAGATYQLLGVGRLEWLDPMAGALAQLGMRRAFLVCGQDGLDEVSLSGPTMVREVRGNAVGAQEWTPEDFGLEPVQIEELHVKDAAESAAVIRSILEGREGAATRIVIANTAAALLAAEQVPTLEQGVSRARGVLHSGQAQHMLNKLVACSRE